MRFYQLIVRGDRLPITITITNYQLPITITNYQLPITNYPLPITHYHPNKNPTARYGVGERLGIRFRVYNLI
jgi:hypothetical protein